MSDGLRQGWYDSIIVWEDRTSRLTSRSQEHTTVLELSTVSSLSILQSADHQ